MKSVNVTRALRTFAQRARIARVLVAVTFAGVIAAGCKSSSEPGVVTSLTISPTSATLAAGGTQQFTVQAKNAAGDILAIPNPTWAVVAGGGTITQAGLFTAGTVAGTFTNTVAVTCSGITVNATIVVTPGALVTITVTPNPVTLAMNATQQFTAVGRDANNNVVAITPVWSIVAGGGTINSSTGLFTAGTTAGTFANTVRATSGSIFGSATVTVTPGALLTITVTPNPATVQVNTTQLFTAVGRDAAGNVVAINPTWTVVNGGGTFPPGTTGQTATFTAGPTAGTFSNTVQATQGSVSGNATVNVTTTPPPPPPAGIVNLGAAAPFGILAGSTVTCVTGGIVNADVGISPGNAITGFGPCVVNGNQHIADPVAAQAQLDLTQAYNTLMGLPCPPANVVGTVNIGGTTKASGVYCSPSSMLVTGNLTLDGGGNANSTFVFQAGTTLTTAGNIILINGALARNVYFVVGSSATLGVGSQWQGNVIALSSITLNDNVTLTGRALARNGAVTLGNNNVITLP
ncbi:MAG: ice-binding family protein [Gemmatimonadota bacterium]|nr:ice-binding family protein [Gemmatimonadota bacterium]